MITDSTEYENKQRYDQLQQPNQQLKNINNYIQYGY